MKYEDENWVKIYTRDTGSWLSVSWQARGLALELARKLPKATGELSLGRRGLEAVAALLRAPWVEIAPFINELITDARFVYDDERKVLCDPQHVERQTAVSSAAIRKQRQRDVASLEVTRGHARSRAVTKEKKEKKEKKERDPYLSPVGDAVAEVWSHYVAVLRRHRPRRRPADMSAKDRATLDKLFEHYSVEDMKSACSGLFQSPHHLGLNDRNTEYLEIKYALRNPDTMIALADAHAPSPSTPAPRPSEDLVDPAIIDAFLVKNGLGGVA